MLNSHFATQLTVEVDSHDRCAPKSAACRFCYIVSRLSIQARTPAVVVRFHGIGEDKDEYRRIGRFELDVFLDEVLIRKRDYETGDNNLQIYGICV